MSKAEVNSDISGSLCDSQLMVGNILASFMYLDFPLACFPMLSCNDKSNSFALKSCRKLF